MNRCKIPRLHLRNGIQPPIDLHTNQRTEDDDLIEGRVWTIEPYALSGAVSPPWVVVIILTEPAVSYRGFVSYSHAPGWFSSLIAEQQVAVWRTTAATETDRRESSAPPRGARGR